MTNSQNDLPLQLENVLNSFLVSGFCRGSNAHFEKLATHLSKKEHQNLLQTPVVAKWIDKCVNILLDDFNGVHHTVVSLMFKLSAIVSENEWLVAGLREKNLLEKITAIVDKNIQKLTPSIKLGHIRLLSAISKHNLGLRWIKESNSWRYLVNYCSHEHTLYVVREASSLIYDVLYQFSAKTYDEEYCLEVLGAIFKPIEQNVFKDNAMVVIVDDSELQKELCSTLDLISLIFQKTLESNEKTPIAHLCNVHFNMIGNTWKLSKVTHNEFFLGKILKAQTSYFFAILVYEKWENNQIDPMDFNAFGVNFFNVMKFCIARRSCVNCLKLAKLNHCLWKKLGTRAPSEIFIENENIQFENQLIVFHLMPVLCIVKTQPKAESIFDNYIMKLFSISSEFTIRICYSFRDILLDCPDLSAHLAYKSIHELLSMKSILNKDQAVVVFQALVYVLKEFTLVSVQKPLPQLDLVLSIPQVLYATLVCLYTLVEGYNITWKESIETMCLMDIALEILKNCNLTSLTIVQAIKLTQLSIEHFLSPNMALLVDNLKDTGLQNLGPIIVKNIHNTEWEVRDSTIELVTSVVSISRRKFPAFQQYVLEKDICPLIFSVVQNDQESYVRASGLKCLTQMITINILWEKNLTHLKLDEYLLGMICNECEGIVRKEAINCLTQMYVHRRINPCNITSMYSTLAQSAASDLYWEVKVAALNFWEIEIYMKFSNQGMIDGTFPKVTFSKQNKKIVTLTESEILLRIKKVLNELSQIGCLDVILKCLDDDCDLEAVKVAVRVIKTLLKTLEKYNFEKSLADEDASDDESMVDGDKDNNNAMAVSESTENVCISFDDMNSDVIDDIVGTSDIQLLINSYQKQMSVQAEQNIGAEANQQTQFIVVKPRVFINRLKSIDFDKLIENRNIWFHCSESLSSLLDDMILSGKIEQPFADCY